MLSAPRLLWGLTAALSRICKRRGAPALTRRAVSGQHAASRSLATSAQAARDTPAAHGPASFVVPASHVTPLLTPADFYGALLAGVRGARRRVTLASLYVGTGPLEQALIANVIEAARAAPELQVNVQLDYCRALRDLGPGAKAPPSAAASAGTPLTGANGGPLPPSSKASPYRSSCHLLMELLHQIPGAEARVHCGLSLLPQLRPGAGLSGIGRFLPQRFIEGAGVLHIKAYAWDDTVLLSGANLASDYFTARQDRYLLLRDVPGLASYVHGFVGELGQLPGSHVLRRDGLLDVVPERGGEDTASVGVPQRRRPAAPFYVDSTLPPVRLDASRLPAPVGGRWGTAALMLPPGDPAAAAATAPRDTPAACCHTPVVDSHLLPGGGGRPPPRRATARLHAAYASALQALLRRYNAGAAVVASSASDTPSNGGGVALVRPFLQFGRCGVRDDQTNTLAILSALGPGDACAIATGYFNMPGAYVQALLTRASPAADVAVLTAAPAANGFLGSKGLSGGIPMLYSEIERRFWEAAAAAGRLKTPNSSSSSTSSGGGVSLLEYRRGGWTFHAKGLWWEAKGKKGEEGKAVAPHFVTLVGSPNFGRRSLDRDIELQFQVTTTDAGLVQRLGEERDALFGGNGGKEGDAVVAPVDASLWATPERRLQGWASWSHGRWIAGAAKVLGGLF